MGHWTAVQTVEHLVVTSVVQTAHQTAVPTVEQKGMPTVYWMDSLMEM